MIFIATNRAIVIDKELKSRLQAATLQMLSPKSVCELQSFGVQIGSQLSDFKLDQVFVALMDLLMKSTSTGIRKMIIRGIKAPYSNVALAFLGKRLRDMSPDVVTLIFDQLTKSETELKDFPTPEARMLVLTEGLTSP